MTRSFRLPVFLSLGTHGVLAAALAAASGGAGTAPVPPPGRVDASLHEIVAPEPDLEPPPPLEDLPLPEIPDPPAEEMPVLDEPPIPEPVDERFAREPEADAAGPGALWTGDGVIGIGPGGPAGRGFRTIRPRPIDPVLSGPPLQEAATPSPGPTTGARPIPGSCPAPDYPARARRLGIEGSVEVRASVDVRGGVASAEVASSSGDASLDAAAVEAAGRWRFEPALRDGVPVPDEYRVRFLFRLDDPAAARGGRP